VALANEIPPDIVRWSGASRVGAFLDSWSCGADAAGCLCTYANYPTTEFLQPRHVDFVAFNVFLRGRGRWRLPRAPAIDRQYQALVLGDAAPTRIAKAGPAGRNLTENLEAAERAGLAALRRFTDDWVNGRRVEDWEMGLTTVDRTPKPAYAAVQACFTAPPPAPPMTPRVTVVVASYNAATTLRACLESLLHLDYPDFEILVIDDGSTDETPRITAEFPQVRTLRHVTNLGLSVARNLGITAATGDVVAFTDADCRADRDWLRLLVVGLLDLRVEGIGGPNLLPPDDSPVAAAVIASPGGPA
jgi:hypothetical protein